MSLEQRGRAVATIARPVAAEVYVGGVWWPGALLGWRHDESGECEARVRVHLPGGERVVGVGLAAVRLPEVADRSPVADGPAETVMMSRAELRERLGRTAPGRTAVRGRRHASDLTAELPVVRCAETVAIAGRHRAPASGGRHRADEEVASAPEPGLLTRPIRLDDVAAAAWPWGASPDTLG